jgi:hypothetical protein
MDMIKAVIAFSAILTLGSVSAVFAQDQTSNKIQGTIRSIDSTNRTVTLESGQTVKLGASADMSGLREGGTIDDTCSGGTMANCTLMQPDTQEPAAQQNSPENQTAPSAGSSSTTNPPPSTGTDNNSSTGTNSGTNGSDGTSGTGSGTSGSGSSGSGSGSSSGGGN